MAKIKQLLLFIFLLCTSHTYALSLDEAVALTLENNFDIQTARLDRRNQKFAVKVSQDAFKWQNNITGESTVFDPSTSNVITSSSSITPTSSIATKYGTTLSFQPHFHLDDGIQPEIVITQNLIRGLNPDVNLADLRNAIDQNEIDKINFKNTISTAISDTLINYINIINTNRKIHSLQRTLQINRDNLEQTKIKFQFGEASKSDVTNKRVSVASTLSDLSSSKSERQGTINKLFDTMNVKRKNISVDNDLVKISHRFSVPSLEKARRGLLNNNLDYLNLKLNLVRNKRTLIKVKDDLNIGLSVTGSTNPIDPSDSSISFSLDAPIHDINKEQAVVNAQVDIQKSERAIQNKAIELSNHASDIINELKLLEKSITEQKQEIDLRIDVIKTNQERLKRGYISSFELSEQINNKEEAIDKYNDLLASFATKVITLYNEMGLTLEQWHVNLPKDF